MPDDALTDLEICLAVLNGVPSYADLAGPDRIIAADRCVAEAQRRKSLWWDRTVGLRVILPDHIYEFYKEELLVGIEPWESEINVR